MSNCCACGTQNGFQDHGWINISPTHILQFVNEDAGKEMIPEANWFICQECTTLSTAAWAREVRRKDQEKNPPPVPTSPPAGDGTAFVERLLAVA